MPLRSLRSLPLFLVLAASGAAWGQGQPPARKPRQAPPPPPAQQHRDARTQDQEALSEAVRRAERNGQVLSAEQVQYDGRDVNRVKIVDSRGRVRVYWDDPAAEKERGENRQDGEGKRGKKPRDGGRTRSDDDGDPTL
jgi:hypothetical protein